MSLDTEKLHRLTGKQFDKLYSQHAAKYTEMAQKALSYAQTCIPQERKYDLGMSCLSSRMLFESILRLRGI